MIGVKWFGLTTGPITKTLTQRGLGSSTRRRAPGGCCRSLWSTQPRRGGRENRGVMKDESPPRKDTLFSLPQLSFLQPPPCHSSSSLSCLRRCHCSCSWTAVSAQVTPLTPTHAPMGGLAHPKTLNKIPLSSTTPISLALLFT